MGAQRVVKSIRKARKAAGAGVTRQQSQRVPRCVQWKLMGGSDFLAARPTTRNRRHKALNIMGGTSSHSVCTLLCLYPTPSSQTACQKGHCMRHSLLFRTPPVACRFTRRPPPSSNPQAPSRVSTSTTPGKSSTAMPQAGAQSGGGAAAQASPAAAARQGQGTKQKEEKQPPATPPRKPQSRTR